MGGKTGNGCDGLIGGDDKEICVGRMYLDLDIEDKNVGSECLEKCGKNGHCPQFCGQDGYCCQKGIEGDGCDGQIGGEGVSNCVGQKFQKSLEVENEGKRCLEKCKNKGYCPNYCGKDGYCYEEKDGNGKFVCLGLDQPPPHTKNEGLRCQHMCLKNSNCPSFCGTHGYCCQLGEEGNQENEKGRNGKEGGKGHFACVDKRPDVENKGMECVPACEENSHCPEF